MITTHDVATELMDLLQKEGFTVTKEGGYTHASYALEIGEFRVTAEYDTNNEVYITYGPNVKRVSSNEVSKKATNAVWLRNVFLCMRDDANATGYTRALLVKNIVDSFKALRVNLTVEVQHGTRNACFFYIEGIGRVFVLEHNTRTNTSHINRAPGRGRTRVATAEDVVSLFLSKEPLAPSVLQSPGDEDRNYVIVARNPADWLSWMLRYGLHSAVTMEGTYTSQGDDGIVSQLYPVKSRKVPYYRINFIDTVPVYTYKDEDDYEDDDEDDDIESDFDEDLDDSGTFRKTEFCKRRG